jgi:hypothetical protein
MTWADYASTTKKAKIHLGVNVNRGIPGKVCLTDGKGDEGPLAPQLLSPGQPGIMDRNSNATVTLTSGRSKVYSLSAASRPAPSRPASKPMRSRGAARCSLMP